VIYIHHVPGRLRLRLRQLKANQPAAQAACEALRPLPGVTHVDSNPATGSVTIRYDCRESALEEVWEVLHRQGLVGSPIPDLRIPIDARSAHGVSVGSHIAGSAAEAAIGFLVEKLLERSAIALIGALI
jgi:copper chaperone CopZ